MSIKGCNYTDVFRNRHVWNCRLQIEFDSAFNNFWLDDEGATRNYTTDKNESRIMTILLKICYNFLQSIIHLMIIYGNISQLIWLLLFVVALGYIMGLGCRVHVNLYLKAILLDKKYTFVNWNIRLKLTKR